jgi:hypothetical protein
MENHALSEKQEIQTVVMFSVECLTKNKVF